MAKQYQSTGAVVNEPSDAQRQYQTTVSVVNTAAVAITQPQLTALYSRRYGSFSGKAGASVGTTKPFTLLGVG